MTPEEDPKAVSVVLDELIKLQEEIRERMSASNAKLESRFENIGDFVSRAQAYVPILNRLPKDMQEVCERTENLKRRIKNLNLDIETTTGTNSSSLTTRGAATNNQEK